MFFIKRAIVKSSVEKKKKKQPFDLEYSEAFTVGSDGDGTFNNSYYFSAHSLKKGESLYTRLGLRNDGSAEVWVYYNRGEKIYSLPTMTYTAESSPLKVFRTEKGWAFTFEGELRDEKGNCVPAKMDCQYQSNRGVVDFFYHMPSIRVSTAMAQDKWRKGYFDEVQENNSVHYEQEGRIAGEVTIGGETFAVDLPCLRDHSYGRRVWDYMNNHLWLAGVDDNFQFNFSMVSYPSISMLEVGHVRKNEGEVEYVTKAHYDRNAIVTGEVPQTLDLELTVNGKRKMQVQAKYLHGVEYLFGDGVYRFVEGIAELEVDGVKCRGILEVGFNRDKSRFMNGKKISKLKE